jgi:hypothetical protein
MIHGQTFMKPNTLLSSSAPNHTDDSKPNKPSEKKPQQSDDSHSDAYLKIMLDLFHERLRQAKLNFNLYVVAVAASLGISVIGAGLLISGKASEGSVTTATGLISTTLCSQIAKESGEKLEELREDLKGFGSSSDS